MVAAGLSIKLRCASWQQLATIYKRDLSKGTMFLKAASPPPLGTKVRIDLTLPSASVIALSGVVTQHVQDPQRGAGVDLALDPLPSSSVWLIESALAAELKTSNRAPTNPGATKAEVAEEQPLTENVEVASAEVDLVKALIAECESLKKLNPFLVLGVGYEATDTDVRAAFGELTKRYHPDRFARYESKDLRTIAAEIFILIRDAYRKLGDESSRAQVLQQLGKSSAPRAVPAKPPPTPGGIPSIVRPGQPARPGFPIRAQTEPGATNPPPPVAKPGGRALTAPGGVRILPPPSADDTGGHKPPVGSGTGSIPVVVDRSSGGAVAVIPTTPKTPPRGVPIFVPPPAPPPAIPPRDEHEAPTNVPGRGEALGRMPPAPTTVPGNELSTPTGPPTVPARPQRAQTAPVAAEPPRTTAPPPQKPDAPTTPRVPQPPPPPPMVETGRPVLAAPPAATAAAEAGDSSELEAMLDAGRADDALIAYKLLSKKHPQDRGYRAGIELCEGLRALAARDRLEAAQRFEAALEIDPSSERAARELAEMRRQATNERKGLLSRLMGKKEGGS
jgi:hypothetical protein